MNGDRGVGDDRFRAGCCYGYEVARLPAAGINQRVTDMPEEGLLLLVVDLQVAEGALATGTPVDQAVAPIDQAVVVELDEDRPDGLRRAGVHRECLTGPVGGDAQALVLSE